MNFRTRHWLLAFAAALAYSAGQATQLRLRGAPIPWPVLFLFEVPVWSSLIVAAPMVFWLARRFPLQGSRTIRNFFVHLAASVVVISLQFLLIDSTRRSVLGPLIRRSSLARDERVAAYVTFDGPFLVEVLQSIVSFGLFYVLCYFALVAVSHGVYNHRELTKARLRSSELQSLLAKSQLDALRTQLQPHFLFNTLNTVSSLMSRDVGLARRMLARLSDLLRMSIRDFPHHETPLSGELEFLGCYLEIQDARFGDRLTVEQSIEEAALDVLVPRMILQPLVENAIRHGMKPGDERLVIRIGAAVLDDRLTLEVADNGTGLTEPLVEGLGLQNTRQRLATLFAESHEMQMAPVQGGGLSVRIVIPARYA